MSRSNSLFNRLFDTGTYFGPESLTLSNLMRFVLILALRQITRCEVRPLPREAGIAPIVRERDLLATFFAYTTRLPRSFGVSPTIQSPSFAPAPDRGLAARERAVA